MNKIYFPVLLVVGLLLCNSASAAGVGGELYATPESSIQIVAEPFVVSVFANTNGDVVNAIEGELAYNPLYFSVDAISIEHSILTTWATTPSYDGGKGIIKFSGWVDHTYSGQSGLLMTVRLRPLRVGQSSLDFTTGAMLSTISHGGNIITSMHSSVFRIEPQQTQAPVPPLPKVIPVVAPVASSSEMAAVATTVPTPSPAPQTPPEYTNAASVALSGFELAPLLVPFLIILTIIAFCIAYVLHKMVR